MTIEKLETLANEMKLAIAEMFDDLGIDYVNGGDLELGEAALFYTASDALDNVLEALAQKQEAVS